MEIIIVGYGRMGHEVESVLTQHGHTMTACVDPAIKSDGRKCFQSLTQIDDRLIDKADAVIEFSLPQGVIENTVFYADANLPAVIGTTGWYDRLAEVEELVSARSARLLYGSNFSIGAHVFLRTLDRLTELIEPFDVYDPALCEYHHRHKKDSPSGTALNAAERITATLSRKKRVVCDRLERAIEPDELHVASVRGGSLPGTHVLTVDSPDDTIELRHSARSRGGFAYGAVCAATWLCEQTAGIYKIDDFIDQLTLT